MKRFLTENEIEDILNYSIVTNNNIPKTISDSIKNNVSKDFKKQLKTIKIYPEKIDELKSRLRKIYYSSLIQPGENVGVLTAQSVGERQTQLTLNSFHSAGLSIATVVTGVPRFSELLNATQNPKFSYCTCYFYENNNNIKELRKHINHNIVELYFKDLYTNFTIYDNYHKSSWHEYYKIFNNIDRNFKICISYDLNKEILYKYSLYIECIAKKIEEEYEDVYCIISPLNIGKLDIFVDVSKIALNQDSLAFITKKNKNIVYIEEIVLNKLNNILISGIKNIKNMFFKIDNENMNKWVIDTVGSNFYELLKNPIIDSTKTISNNIWDIYNIFGIEAGREFLIEEFLNVISSDGTYINISHIQLLVDLMCFSGNILSISRYGINIDQVGPISKASFEESLENFKLAGVYSLIDNTQGVSSSVMVGKRSNIGTGLCKLKLDLDQII